MTIAGDLGFVACNPFLRNPSNINCRPAFVSSSSSFSSMFSLSSKLQFRAYSTGASNDFETKHRNQISILSNDAHHLDTVKMSFLERLSQSWKILFPAEGRDSNAKIAKQRLKMILVADRCAISDEAKRKIVASIIEAMSDFVEIESSEKVQLSVSAETGLGTVYSVSVPVRRVKPGFQQSDKEDLSGGSSFELNTDEGEQSGCIDASFELYAPGKKIP